MYRSRLALVATAAAVVLLGACGGDDPQLPKPTIDLPGSGTVVELSTSASCVAGGEDLEGRFTEPAQMNQYLECILPGIVEWVGATYSSMPQPKAFNFVPAGVSGTDTGCEYDDAALKYCIDAQTVYFGQAAVWDQYTRFGDAAPAVIAAHEVTHHFQEILQMPEPKLANEVIRYENQADCGAGAFMSYARAKGWMNMDDDIKDLAGSLQAAAETEGPNRTHGTIDERLQSFDLAYTSQNQQPMAECVSFVPEVPIIN